MGLWRDTLFGTVPRWHDGDAIRLRGVEETYRLGEADMPIMELWNPKTRTWEDLLSMGYRSMEVYVMAPDLPDDGAERLGLDESNGLYGYVLDASNFEKVGRM